MRQPAVQPAPPELVLRSVTKHFPTRRGRIKVLDRVSLSVRKGEFLCLLGPSGCGKSTLFNIIAGLEEPDSGEVLVEGEPVAGPGPDRVLVFQDGALFPWLTALGNVEFGLSLQNIPRAERRERAMAALEMVRLARFRDAYIHELSGGMRQRVAIARALALEPKVLLMDEPFAALDAQTRNLMHEELQRIWARTGQTIIFVTHNVSEAIRLGDRIAVLSFRPGRVRREVTIQHPRPRKADDPHLLEIRTFLVRDLRSDVEAALEEELRDG
ncbi:ABC transporter ATP-binding protein [Symbiobacterium thermophilum]|uniref:Nitrate/sulfonate/bicarbonate ABC transporter ATP-binding protein n=1 Tax=Symbiobacterium thermophilum TaxID=2734 RepID=A0A953LHT2_SYMTR|nr:ABC transporter ATP-binding protein [Symbiobacterium thermophilum]MBY6275284.1 nitrate/sulfonate/bicarbonate ABC transporter ATP-binding protein [Symbiobacterium thermophilum]